VGKKNLKKILELIQPLHKPLSKASWKLSLRRGVRIASLACQFLPAIAVFGCTTDLASTGGELADRLQSGKVLAWDGLQGRWAGPVVPTDPSCGTPTQGLLSIGEGGFGFDPFQSTTVIEGKVTDDSRLTGNLVRQNSQHQSLTISFEAAASGSDTIAGTLQSGRCHWTVTLHRD
jgi:hypothetical protein